MTDSKKPKAPAFLTQAAYGKRRGVSRQYIGRLAKGGVLIMREGLVDVQATDAALDDRALVAPEAADTATGYAAARLEREIFTARLRRLEFEAKSGTLIPLEMVTKKWTATAAMIKTRFEALPSKLAPRVAAITDARQVRELLAKEIKTILAGLTEEIRKS